MFASPALQGGLYAAPDPAGFRAFSGRYRTSTAPSRCEPQRSPMTPSRWSRRWRGRKAPQRFSPDVLTSASGFAGIDGLFRFRTDGTNERGLAVMRVATERRRGGRGLAEEFWGLNISCLSDP